jgi:hypothetical protein
VFDKIPNYHTKILLGDFIAKIDKKDIFKSTIGNESLHKIGNDNGVRSVNFVTSKNLRVKSTMFPYRIRMYLMFDHSGQQIVIPTTIWWWQKLGSDLAVNKKKITQISYGEVKSQEVKRGRS